MRHYWFATTLVACVTGGLIAVPTPRTTRAVEAKKNADAEVEAAVAKGLEYLKKTQAKDGHWEAPSGQYPTSMTALAGMALLMEGSTLKEGKYTDQVKAAVDWFLAPNRQQANGLIGDARNPSESTRYMYGQGFGTLFLASVYGEEEDKDQREKLEKLLTKAVEFTCKAQTSKRHKQPEGKEVEIGGWGYVSAADDANFDEGSVTITALQGLRAAKNAGIPVPKETIDKAVRYLEACTTSDGGVIYNYLGGVAARGQERPALTVAAICCGFSAGQYGGELPKKWLKYCKAHEGMLLSRGRQAHDEYQTYYFGQAMYALGETKYGELFPDQKERDKWLTWGRFKDVYFRQILDTQDRGSGAWEQGYVGPVYATSVNLCLLQLEKGILPIYQR